MCRGHAYGHNLSNALNPSYKPPSKELTKLGVFDGMTEEVKTKAKQSILKATRRASSTAYMKGVLS
ncbi:hypothetical protein [Escherichia phage vB_EcoP_EcoN5]|uniref:Uncharacterized protein n=1 Tax=Escherichia phage vB_EcoP_EcoN5 TaxID=2686238 RepID=A0A7L4XTG3_9CAUD|nr:hypothetical protein PQC47_gp114 [Escherichia phage vB_EcoP_EcoN5]QGZ13813.1 hypothetical protein [Escherichia phage vB_EcoP_EcoN5]